MSDGRVLNGSRDWWHSIFRKYAMKLYCAMSQMFENDAVMTVVTVPDSEKWKISVRMK